MLVCLRLIVQNDRLISGSEDHTVAMFNLKKVSAPIDGMASLLVILKENYI